MPGRPPISVVDPADDATLEAWHAVERASILPERPHAVLTSPRHRVEGLRHPTPYLSTTLLVARDGTDVVGIAEVGLPQDDNLHLAQIEVCVLPSHRRRGLGRALYDEAARLAADAGRSTVIGEAHTTEADQGATAFAEALGFTSVHVEDHLVLALPMPDERRRRLEALAAAAPRAAGVEIVTWGDHCTDELLPGYVRMRSQMNADEPRGELDMARVPVDEARVRAGEALIARSYAGVVAAARRVDDGSLCGYSRMLLEHRSTVAVQDDTLVMPEARGHRLGLALKLATLGVVEREHPGRASIHTWTAPDNHAMLRTNLALGFVAVEVLHEMQRAL